MPSTTDTRDRTRRAPGAAFDTITGALAGLYDVMVCTVAAQLDRQAGA